MCVHLQIPYYNRWKEHAQTHKRVQIEARAGKKLADMDPAARAAAQQQIRAVTAQMPADYLKTVQSKPCVFSGYKHGGSTDRYVPGSRGGVYKEGNVLPTDFVSVPAEFQRSAAVKHARV